MRAFFERWYIAALGDIDSNGIVFTGGFVIPIQRQPQSAGLDAHDGVDALIKIISAAEDLGRHRVALDAVGLTLLRPAYDIF